MQSQNIFANARSSGLNLTGLHSGRFRLLGGTTNFWGGELLPFDPIVFDGRPALVRLSSSHLVRIARIVWASQRGDN